MKKLVSIMAIATLVFVGTLNANATTVLPMSSNTHTVAAVSTVSIIQDEGGSDTEESIGFHQELKNRFVEGGPGFMGIVLLCLILGLAFAIERIIYLNLSTTNTQKLANKVEDALKSGGLEAAKEVCRNTKGPVASIYYQGLERADESLEAAEKSIIAYGGVQMGQLEEKIWKRVAPMERAKSTISGAIDLSPTAVSIIMGKKEIRNATRILGVIPTPNQTRKSGAREILGTVWKNNRMGVMKRSKLGEAVIAIAMGMATAIARK